MSRSRISRPFDRKLTARMSCSERKAPETWRRSFSSPVCSEPDGLTAFCAWSAAINAARSMPRPASWCVEDLDTGNVGNVQQPRADVLDVVAQLAMSESLRGEAIDQPVGVAELVVEPRSDDAGRKRVTDIADALANLIPDVGNRGRFC